MRQTLYSSLLALLLATASSALLAQGTAGAEPSGPNELVKWVIDGVMQSVHQSDAPRSGDVGALARVVEQKFVPYTDFQRTARIALADAWKTATPDQQRQLVAQFQTLIVHVYATELTQVSDRSVAFRFENSTIAPGATDAIIRTRLVDNGEDDAIAYRLEKTAAGWRIYDINILGTWLSQIYRHQFEGQLAKGGVPALIESLAQHNARAAN
jgi:ABC-type transporter MlaC component